MRVEIDKSQFLCVIGKLDRPTAVAFMLCSQPCCYGCDNVGTSSSSNLLLGKKPIHYNTNIQNGGHYNE